MPTAEKAKSPQAASPIDIIEAVVSANEWSFQRSSDEELSVEFPGHWCAYHLHFVWSEDLSALHLSCFMDMKVPKRRQTVAAELITFINEKLWLGSFVLPKEERTPVFRHTILLRGTSGASTEQLEDVIDIALTECERFYPAFQFATWGGKTAEEAVAAAILETVGEA